MVVDKSKNKTNSKMADNNELNTKFNTQSTMNDLDISNSN